MARFAGSRLRPPLLTPPRTTLWLSLYTVHQAVEARENNGPWASPRLIVYRCCCTHRHVIKICPPPHALIPPCCMPMCHVARDAPRRRGAPTVSPVPAGSAHRAPPRSPASSTSLWDHTTRTRHVHCPTGRNTLGAVKARDGAVKARGAIAARALRPHPCQRCPPPPPPPPPPPLRPRAHPPPRAQPRAPRRPHRGPARRRGPRARQSPARPRA